MKQEEAGDVAGGIDGEECHGKPPGPAAAGEQSTRGGEGRHGQHKQEHAGDRSDGMEEDRSLGIELPQPVQQTIGEK